MFLIFGILLLVLGVLALVVVFFARNIFGNFAQKAEKMIGKQDIGTSLFDYFLSSVYLNIGFFLFLPGIVCILIDYFY